MTSINAKVGQFNVFLGNKKLYPNALAPVSLGDTQFSGGFDTIILKEAGAKT
ncbi:MAG: hypothetical protein R2830_03335 [Saprospiraceae bacterium]